MKMSLPLLAACRSFVSLELLCCVLLSDQGLVIALPELGALLGLNLLRQLNVLPQRQLPSQDRFEPEKVLRGGAKNTENQSRYGIQQPSETTRLSRLAVLLLVLSACSAVVWPRLNASGVLPHTVSHSPDLLHAGVEELVAGLESGAWTSVQLTKAYIRRIEEVNPTLHAVTELNPDALSIAAALDAERASGIIRSTLHGIPLLIKDNIATSDKMNNTAGSYALVGAKVPRDATVVAKLRAAGVILLGKASMSQWANFRSQNSSHGWSSYGGQVIGAYFPNMEPSGSSSGSGVSASIGLALAALGTETDGSILLPSNRNNVVGIKPTVGLTSRYLVIPISQRQDTVGPMARTVSDAAHVLSIIAGTDVNDNWTSTQPWDSPPDYTQSLDFFSLRGARIGIPRNGLMPEDTSQPVLDAFEDAITVIKNAGAIVVDNANYSAWDEFIADTENPLGNEMLVLKSDFVSEISNYFSHLTENPNNITSLADAANFTHNSNIEEYPGRDTVIWDGALSLGHDNSDYRTWNAYQRTTFYGGEGGVTGALKAFNLDALILPTDYSPSVPACAGLPVVTVPMGFYPSHSAVVKTPRGDLVDVGPGMPFGLSFMGPKWSEQRLIGYAYAYEQRTHKRLKGQPYLAPRAQLADIIGR